MNNFLKPRPNWKRLAILFGAVGFILGLTIGCASKAFANSPIIYQPNPEPYYYGDYTKVRPNVAYYSAVPYINKADNWTQVENKIYINSCSRIHINMGKFNRLKMKNLYVENIPEDRFNTFMRVYLNGKPIASRTWWDQRAWDDGYWIWTYEPGDIEIEFVSWNPQEGTPIIGPRLVLEDFEIYKE